VSNAWVIYPGVGDNPPKGGLIPHNIFSSKEVKIKDGLCICYRFRMSLRPIS